MCTREFRCKQKSLLNYASYLISCPTCFVLYVLLCLMCLQCLISYMLSCLTCLVPCVLLHLTHYVFSCSTCSHASCLSGSSSYHVLQTPCFMGSRASPVSCAMCSRAWHALFFSTCSRVSHASCSSCSRVSGTSFPRCCRVSPALVPFMPLAPCIFYANIAFSAIIFSCFTWLFW